MQDLGVLTDGNADGVGNDPAFMILAVSSRTGKNLVQINLVETGSRLKDIEQIVGTDFQAKRLAGVGDISGNNVEEVSALAEKLSDQSILIKLRDYATGKTTTDIFP